MAKLAWVLVMLIGLACITYSSQYGTNPLCFGQSCPPATTSCKEDKKSSRDRQRIEIKISCLDASDASIKDYYFEERSSLDPYTSYSNTRYESINEGISRGADPYRQQSLDLTPHHQDYFY